MDSGGAASSDEHSSEMDDTSFLRTDDLIYLSSVLPGTSTRICLCAEEFGQRSCFLQDCQNKDIPMEMTFSSFIIEEALSVRALQEIVGQKNASEETQAVGGSHRTLLYGHAILLRHQASEMYLACLSSSSGSDKLAFDVGLQETVQGESCWWTVHPASKQRSEGEKVRVGDDLILVSVASERYLHVNSNRSVDASFHQTLWTVIPICSGLSRVKNVGVVFGSDVVRFFHGHMEECLTVSAVETDGQSQFKLMFEGEAAAQHARSLWCLEHIRNRWAGACFSWNSKCRIRHVTTGRYLAVTSNNEIALVPRNRADQPVCSFHLRKTKDVKQLAEIPPDEDEEEGVDLPDIKYGDTVIFPQFAANGQWLSYKSYETQKIGVGRVEEKQAVVLPEGRMDDGLTMTRAPDEDSKAARVIRKCTSLFSRFIRGLDALQSDGSDSVHWKRVNLDDIFRCLLDLIAFFAEPDENEEHESKMKKTRALRNRQNLFQEEGMLALMLDANDKLSGFSSQQLVAERGQETLTQRFDELQNQLYLLIAAMIKGNRGNCALFAEKPRLDWLFSRLSNQQSSSKGVLEVLHYILIESPEVLNMIRVEHIQAIMSLIDKHGRDAKILQVLSALCIASNDKMAVRNNQNVICEHLQANRSVLLETRLTDQVASVRPNLFVGLLDDCAYYRKWYYEVVVDHVEVAGSNDPVLRVGWACTNAFSAVIGGGERLGAQAAGEDLSSFAFDGQHLWTGSVSRCVAQLGRALQRGDTIGCLLDLGVPEIRFTWNGARVNGCIRELSIYGMLHPVVTLSARVGFRFVFGGTHGKFAHPPPEDFAPLYEALMPGEQLCIEQCFSFGEMHKCTFAGSTAFDGVHMFVPRPVVTKHVQLPMYLEVVRDHLAENLHEMWSASKIEQGWSYGEEREDATKRHPYLTSFDKLPKNEKQYNLALAFETLRIILALDYRINVNAQMKSSLGGSSHRLKTVRLPNTYMQSNNYRPAPLDLSAVQLGEQHRQLVQLLAENTHNVWCADRISQGWTFGVADDPVRKRSPLLLPFSKVDPYIRRINVETAANTIKTLLVHGCIIDLASTEHGDEHGGKGKQAAGPGNESLTTDLVTPLACLPRSFRAQANYAVAAGRWYYEITILTAGYVRIGWAHVQWDAQCELGSDDHSYAFDGVGPHATKVHNRAVERFGKRWHVGAIVGCLLNLNDRTVSFALNGEVLMDQSGQEVAFRNVDTSHPFVPAISLKPGQKVKANFGQDVDTLKYFSSGALQEGYEPYCVNMTRSMPFCYSNTVAQFCSVDATRSRIEVQKSATSAHAPPKLTVQSSAYGRVEKPEMETVRLGLPIMCSPKLSAANSLLDSCGSPTKASSKEERRRSISQPSAALKRMSVTQNQPVADTGGPVARKIAQKFTDLKESLDERIPKRSVARSPFNLFRTRSPSPAQAGAAAASGAPRGAAKNSEGKPERKPGGKAKEGKGRLANMLANNAQDEDMDINVRKASHAAIGLPLSVFEGVARQFEQKIGPVNEHRPALVLFFLVRVLPGQDLDSVHVGWVTAGFSGYMYKSSLTQSVAPMNIRRASLLQYDAEGQNVVDGLHLRDCYMLPVKEVFNKYSVSEDVSKRVSQGLLFSCFIDVANGQLTFEMNGRRLPIDFRVPFDVPLYPAVTCTPTTRDMFEFLFEFPESTPSSNPSGQPASALGQRAGIYPLTMIVAISRLVASGTPAKSSSLTSHRSQRIEVQALSPAYWSRVPTSQIRPHIMKLSDVRGWSIVCEDTVPMMKVSIAQDSRSIDILELNELYDLQTYFANMLDLYKAVCYQGNASATLLIRGWIDERQILYACENQFLPGSLRVRFYDLLNTLYLESAANSRLLMQSEYILPIAPNSRNSRIPSRTFKRVDAYLRFHAVPPPDNDEFAMPAVDLACSNVLIAGGKRVDFIQEIKKYCLSALSDITRKHLETLRDPVGESHANCIVPLLKVIDRFLVMNALEKSELYRLLSILDPSMILTHGELHNHSESLSFKSLPQSEGAHRPVGLLEMDLDSSIKLELCHIFHHLVDIQMRNRVREVIGFAEEYTNFVQRDQLRRYVSIKQADLPPSVTAKKTREFRCPPKEQMRTLLSAVKKDELADEMTIENFYDCLLIYHNNLVVSCDFSTTVEICMKEDEAIAAALCPVVEEDGTPLMEKVIVGLANKFRERVRKMRGKYEPVTIEVNKMDIMSGNTLSQVIVKTIMKWTRNEQLKNNELIREIFALLYRQYGALEELMNALDKTYVISSVNQRDINSLVKNLSMLRALIDVQLEPAEEELLKSCMWKIMDNTIFFQHPDLIRTLSVHETVMQLMVKTLKKTQQQQTSEDSTLNTDALTPTLDGAGASGTMTAGGKSATEMSVTMVVMCCRFLCYFCRTSRVNQKAMFDHLSYMLDNCEMLLDRPSQRGQCPIDVGYFSFMDNTELTLALRESHLEKIVQRLARCGVQSNPAILAKGYPDIGWDPIVGERFLDFLKFTVWVNGESVEENANLVVRLLIRKPECLGPALRGSQPMSEEDGAARGAEEAAGGGGLMKAIQDGIMLSVQVAIEHEGYSLKMPPLPYADRSATAYDDDDPQMRNVLLAVPKCAYDLTRIPPGDDEDYVNVGSAMLAFYSVLVDLLGRCAAEASRSDTMRIRAILRSLVSMEDLQQVLSLRFLLPTPQYAESPAAMAERLAAARNFAEQFPIGLAASQQDVAGMPKEDGASGADEDAGGDLPGLQPEHKAAMVNFLERVYGIEDRHTFNQLLESSFLSDLRTANLLDSAGLAECDMALALNRYLFGSILPLLTKLGHFFATPDVASSDGAAAAQAMDDVVALYEATLHTVYRLSQCKSLTKGQCDAIADFLIAFTKQLRPQTMRKLLRKVVHDVTSMSNQTSVALMVLTNLYERCASYYGHKHGHGGAHASASEEERRLTVVLFTGLFDALAQKPADPELFQKALSCLIAIGCAISPDYAMRTAVDTRHAQHDASPHTAGADEQPKQRAKASQGEVKVLDTPRYFSDCRVSLDELDNIQLSITLQNFGIRFAAHYHDLWVADMIVEGWEINRTYSERDKRHPNLVAFSDLPEANQRTMAQFAVRMIQAILVCGYDIESGEQNTLGGHASRTAEQQRTVRIVLAREGYPGHVPKNLLDLRNIVLSKDLLRLSDMLSEKAHEIWLSDKLNRVENEGDGLSLRIVPFDQLTAAETRKEKRFASELLKYFHENGYRIERQPDNAESDTDSGVVDVTAIEKRFAYRLLERLLEYADKAIINLKQFKPSERCSEHRDFVGVTTDVKFFMKAVLPFIERYFRAHSAYFANPTGSQFAASQKEKEIVAILFCKLATLLRQKMTSFGHDLAIGVRCLQTLIQATDIRAVAKYNADFVRANFLPFFNNAASDLMHIYHFVSAKRLARVRGTTQKAPHSISYMNMVLVPTCTATFEHLARTGTGEDLLVGEVQFACYRILVALYKLGVINVRDAYSESTFTELIKHRHSIGSCIAAFSSCFPVAFLEPEFNQYNRFSLVHGVEPNDPEMNPNIKEVLQSVAQNIHGVREITATLQQAAEMGGRYAEEPFILDIILPMFCSYLPVWWGRTSDGSPSVKLSNVTDETLNTILGCVLKLIMANMRSAGADWMMHIAALSLSIVNESSASMLEGHFLPVAKKLAESAKAVADAEAKYQQEKRYQQSNEGSGVDLNEMEEELVANTNLFVRDLFAFYPLLIKYVDVNRALWLKNPSVETQQVFQYCAEIFIIWSRSALIKKEEQNFLTQSDTDYASLLESSQTEVSTTALGDLVGGNHAGKAAILMSGGSSSRSAKRDKRKREKRKSHDVSSLFVVSVKRTLPIGMSVLGGLEQELIQYAKERFIQEIDVAEETNWMEAALAKDNTEDMVTYLRPLLNSIRSEAANAHQSRWKTALYRKIGHSKLQIDASARLNDDVILHHVVVVTRVLRALHVVEHPPSNVRSAWRKLVTSQRKRAVIACFRMVPLHNLPRHRVVNLFIRSYKDEWLAAEETTVAQLIQDITSSMHRETPALETSERTEVSPTGAPPAPCYGDPLKSLIESFIRTASAERKDDSQIAADPLFVRYAQIMSMSCSAADEDGDDAEEDGGAEETPEGGEADGGNQSGSQEDGGGSIEEAELQKQQLLFEQGRLAQRGAAEMVLQYIGICKGEQNEVLEETINLGIAILQEGNQDVQQRMLENLKEKKDVDFFTSIAGLIRNCSVLDLDAFERCNKADNLGVAAEGKTLITNLYDAEFTCKLFRFLQLLCEGHNAGWQNYLRSQAGNSTTVNLVVATVDYLLRLQESISDFYWYYSSKPAVDTSGTENFCKAICIGKQVFNTLTEYIQGPCVGNQMTLAHSRLWDAVNGFLFVFAHMQDKLSRDASQLRLLREFMELQNEMMVLLLSMLEGNVLNGPIGRQMVDTLAESSANVEMILKFFEIFLKMKNCTTSEQFQQFDVNGDGIISHQEFRTAMEQMKLYSAEEIEYIMVCVDANADGKVDFNEFSERFHNPVKEIGLIVAILLTNLSEHMTHDVRLERILARAKSVLSYFEPYLGRIEIKGRNSRIERVYFEVTQSYIDQWEKPQIKDSKRSFLHSVVSEGGEKEKLESFVNFCEDTIFEMQHAQEIGADELQMRVVWNACWRRVSESLRFQIFVWTWFVLCFVARILVECANRERIYNAYLAVRCLKPRQVLTGFVRMQLNFIRWSIRASIRGSVAFVRALWMVMRGDLESADVAQPLSLMHMDVPKKRKSDSCTQFHPARAVLMDGIAGASELLVDRQHATGECSSPYHSHNGAAGGEAASTPDESEDMERVKRAKMERRVSVMKQKRGSAGGDAQPAAEEEEAAVAQEPEFANAKFDVKRCLLSQFARSFYKMKLIALAMAFFINFVLLFYRVARISVNDTEKLEHFGISMEEVAALNEESLLEASVPTPDLSDNVTALEVPGDEEQEELVFERVIMDENMEYMDTLIRLLALMHSCFSFGAVIAYYQLKVPLVIFKTEKEIARQLEFEGMWIAEQPESDNLKSHWNRMVISTPSFPAMYWDKFVKKKVREKYAEQYDDAELARLLGMDSEDIADESKFSLRKKRGGALDEQPHQVGRVRLLIDYFKSVDWRYYFWQSGIILTDNSFLYLLWYFCMSLLGNWNHFFFAAHLLDVAVGFKTLRTILQSVTHNGKQLVLTVMLTSIVVYLYTVLAFNFFRKFYIQEEDGKKDYKCHDMGSCFIFHLHTGLRAGGGIGDEIESPDGDESENYRILFDITFFFFVIVILLAIIQGLIIDAFGELRDQIEQVREDMESKCFICGIDREFFNKVPHGFEKHVQHEHNFANYMFFLMHLINKPETEYTGQESYVWELYSQRNWDFFPVGDCFRKQYEDQLAG